MMQIRRKTVVELEAKELQQFLREVEKLLYDTEEADANLIRDFIEDALTEIEEFEKKPARG